MSTYRYTAKELSGEIVEASTEAASRYEALASLHSRQMTVIRLEDIDQPEKNGETSRRARYNGRSLFRLTSISLGDRALFCRQLAISMSSGVPLREALDAIATDMDDPALRRIVRKVIAQIDDGKMFSHALAGLESVFSKLFVAMVRAAEEAGTMAATLNYLADSMEKADRLARKIRSITAYPAFVAIFFFIVSLIMTLFVLPQFQQIFGSFNAKLPLLTLWVFAANNFLIANSLIIAAAILILVIGLKLYGRTRQGRAVFDRVVLKTPFFGPLLRKLAVARFCRNLAMLLRGGVPVVTAIEITAGTLANKALEQSLEASRKRIISGSAIATSLDPDYFPRLMTRMVSVGESSGRLPEVLDRVSNVYEDQAEGSIMMATSLFEPIIICVFGTLILTLVLAIYMPVFTVASSMK